jgi:cell division septum initiation protein DivIVA
MDVTPQELRGTEIKEAWRGFNRDEVDDLLERAASTIEHLTRQIQELESRLTSAPPAAAAAAAPAPLPSNRDDAEMLQRTLLLAQRAADDAVNEAQARARQLVEESEARAQSLVSEAESTARRIAESERRRLDDEIRDLASRRDRLSSDATALEAYVSGYRDRLREAIEADLARLDSSTVEPPGPRPELHDVELPPQRADAPASAQAAEPERGRVAWEPTRTNSNDTHSDALAAPLGAATRAQDDEWPPATDAVRTDTSSATRDDMAAQSSALGAEIPSSWLSDIEGAPPVADSDAPAPWDHATAEHQPFAADTPIEAHAVDTSDDDLDDDAFFASLREAVRDDAPLSSLEESTAFFDDQPADTRRSFRRRR